MKEKIMVIFVIFITFLMGDVVITNKEVIYGTVTEVDSLYTRLRLPGGGIKVVKTRDVYEIRLSDSSRIEALANKLPGVRVLPDTGKIFFQPEMSAKQISFYDPVDKGIYMFGGHGSYLATKGGSDLILMPYFSYFVVRSIAVGGELTISRNKTGEFTNSFFALGPKVWFVLGASEGYNFFLGEIGLAWASFGKDVTGTRTSFGVGYLPVIGGYIGIPIKVSFLIDDAGGVSTNSWLISIGLCGLVNPIKLLEER
jgi:hypothetical protein